VKIKQIHIVEGVPGGSHDMDDIHLETDLPVDGCTHHWWDGENWYVDLILSVERGNGVTYCKKHFPKIKRHITNISKGIFRPWDSTRKK
jgi:hypothetical protein